MAKLDHILTQQMSRRDFILALGYGLLSLIGITAFLSALGVRSNAQKGSHSVDSGFGSGPYGGPQDSSKKDVFGDDQLNLG